MTTVNFLSSGTTISAELYKPAGGSGEAIVIVHGSDGLMEPWGSAIRAYGQSLAERGFTALIPAYFEKTGTVPGFSVLSELNHLPEWAEVIAQACAFAVSLSGRAGQPPGLLGFSLGGHLALRLRSHARAVVDFFGPELKAFGGIGPASDSPGPPVQIHHGLRDVVVPFSETESIAERLAADGEPVEVFRYEGATHGFAGSDASNATASRVSSERALAFFERMMNRS